MSLVANYGMTFPQRINNKGFFEFTGDLRALVRASIHQILGTRIGARVMLPEFGSRIWELLMEPIDSITVSLARVYTIEAVKRWEPRVILNSVEVEINPDYNRLIIYGGYTIHNQGIVDEFAVSFPKFAQGGNN